ncbi:SDR family oxidoreductase [Rariglobus hedericola]|uniref:SDR family oxidoreductase n=1 Tax=Rariglobus hedericola TaxID=2597822 RepID=A0A556QGQ3_9BACT|nr:SDR family oxidoreductase [Rariglobus hedericola]TSJ75814.1 SDR family oxidoreductase [Rariglobus hedericola]
MRLDLPEQRIDPARHFGEHIHRNRVAGLLRRADRLARRLRHTGQCRRQRPQVLRSVESLQRIRLKPRVFRQRANVSVYAATKAAVDGLTRSFAKELGARKIRVNSINPGLVETEGLHASPVSQGKDAVAASTPLGRIGQPDDIAPAVVYLASDDSSWVTGETHTIAGGVR